jgi:hypothetical protein
MRRGDVTAANQADVERHENTRIKALLIGGDKFVVGPLGAFR